MITQEDAGGLPGIEVYDNAGERVGSVNRIFVDPHSGDPQWVTVRTGAFDFQDSFVPLRDARLADGRLTVAVAQDRIKQAPLLDSDAPLLREQSDRLESHYGFGSPAPSSASASASSDDAMTRSEERLVAGTRPEPVEKVRLRKYLVTEEQQITVPVTREEVRLERVPADEADDAGDARADDGPGPDVILHAERPVVRMESVPVERVRLGKETIHDEETVTGEVRKEQIRYEGPGDETAR